MADQQRRDLDLETKIQLLLLDIRNLNSELLTAETLMLMFNGYIESINMQEYFIRNKIQIF